MQPQKLLILINACFSGHVQAVAGALGGAPPAAEVLGTAPSDQTIELLADGEGRALITASRSNQQSSYYTSKPHTFFGQAVIDGLRGIGLAGAGGYVGLFEFYTFIHAHVKQAAAGLGACKNRSSRWPKVLAVSHRLAPSGGAALDMAQLQTQAPQLDTVRTIQINITTPSVSIPAGATVNIYTAGPVPSLQPIKPRVYLSHYAAEPNAAATLAVLTDQLAQAGFEVLSDPNRARAGVALPDGLYNSMALAHGAILLLSPQALSSEAVWSEARFLTARHLLGEEVCTGAPFRLLRVVLDDVTPVQMQVSRLARLKLDALPLISGATPDALAAQVLGELASLKNVAALCTRLEELEELMMSRLEKVQRTALIAALRALKLEPQAAMTEVELRRWLARGLWMSDVDRWVTTVEHLTPYVPEPQDLVDLFAPAWLDPWVMRCVLDAIKGRPRARC